jgi:hypothetical protein
MPARLSRWVPSAVVGFKLMFKIESVRKKLKKVNLSDEICVNLDGY